MADPILVAPGQIVGQGDWDALFTQHGGMPRNQQHILRPPTDKEIENATLTGAPDPMFQQRPIYRYNLADGSYVEARTSPDGAGWEIVAYQPSQKFQQAQAQATRQEQQNQAPTNGKPFVDDGPEAGSSGRRWGWNPQTGLYDRDLGPSPSAQKPQEASKPPQERVNPSDPTRRQVWNPQANNGAGAWEDAGTVAQDASKPPQERVNPADPTKRQVWNPQANGGKGAWEDGGAVAQAPEKPQPQQASDGSWGYWDRSATPPKWVPIQGPAGKKYAEVKFDEDNGVWWGLTPDGTWERMQGGPGTQPSGRGPGPSAPQIILGHSTEGLRQYGDTLNQAVAKGDLTPAMATQRWNQAVQMAQVAYNEATILQREQESNLNASTQLATNRMSNAMSGFNTALQVVANLNDKLPVGSDLGGKAFAAILGLQMAHAQRMGAYDNIVPGSQPSIRDIMSQPATAPPSGPTAAPAAPPPPAAESAPPPPPAASPAVDQAPASPPLITQPSLITSPPPEPPAGEPESALPNFTDPTTGRFGIPGSFVTGPYSQPAVQGEAAPTSDYPVLANLAPPPPPPVAPAFTPEPTYGSLPPALLYTQAASTPFWRLSEDQIAQMRAAGIPESVIRSGTTVAA